MACTVVTCTALLLHVAYAVVAREEVPFSNAWRFHFGPGGDDVGPGPGNNWSFPTLITNCSDMYHNPNRFTEADCEIACAYNAQCEGSIYTRSVR